MNRRKKFTIWISGFAVAFTLMLVMFFPVFNGKSGLNIIGTLLDDNAGISPVASDPPPTYGRFGNWAEPEIFNVTATETENIITINTSNNFTWKFFKDTFGYNEIWHNGSILVQNEQWWLEYQKNPVTWKPRGTPYNVTYEQLEPHHVVVTRKYTDYISTDFNVTFDFYSNNRVKISLVGDIGQADTYRVRWDATGINTENIQHNHSSNRTKIWNGVDNDSMVFDYLDVYESFGNITSVEVEHQANNHKLHHYFNVGELGVGGFELDPTFGQTTPTGVGGLSLEGYYGCGYFQATHNCVPEYITAYVYSTVDNNEICASIYDSSKNLVANSTECSVGSCVNMVTANSTWHWKQIEITTINENLVNDNWYFLTVWATGRSGVCTLQYNSVGGNGAWKSSGVETDYFIWDDPASLTEHNADGLTNIYCTYSPLSFPPTITNPNPSTNSFNESVGTVTCNVTITDADGNQSTVDFYTSGDNNSWTHQQTNSSVLNESVQFDYTTTEYQTIYYWKVYANDTEYNVSATYEFETTPYRTNYFNDTFLNENFIATNHNMTHETGWENFTYSTGSDENVFFDSFEGTGIDADITTEGNWSDGGGDFKWRGGDCNTPSGSTGCTACIDGSRIIYTEASSRYSKNYYLESDTFTGASNITVDFRYHMYGVAMGTLRIQIWDGSAWDSIWGRTGQQQASGAAAWGHGLAYADAGNSAPYTGTTKIRIWGYTGTAYTSDFCVDQVYVNKTTDDVFDAYLTSSTIYRQNTNWDKFYADVNDTTHCSFALSDPATHYNITTGLTGNGDDISSVTNASVYIYGNFSDASVNMGSWNISWNAGGAGNTAPTITGEIPANASTAISLQPTCNVTVTDADSNTMDVTFASNYSGSWVNYQTNSTVSTGTSVEWDFTGANTELTKYWWKVYCNDGTVNISEWYYFTTAANETWNVVTITINGTYSNTTTFKNIITTINGSYSNTTNWKVIISTINGSYSNTTVWKNIITTINGTYSNTTAAISWNVVTSTINGTYSNNTAWKTIISTINGTYSNISTAISWNVVISTINGTYSNTTTWATVIATINGTYSNDTEVWNIVITTINGTYSNTTTGIITISNPYPTNESTLMDLQPNLRITISHKYGNNMNITWYDDNGSILLGSTNTVGNGTYTFNHFNATNYSTTYYWKVYVNAGGITSNKTYEFTPGYEVGRSPSGAGLVMAALMVGFLAIALIFIFKKRERIRRY